MNKLVRIPFHGNHILAVDVDGTPMVAMKPVCEAIGLTYGSQYNRVQRQAWATVSMMKTVSASESTEGETPQTTTERRK